MSRSNINLVGNTTFGQNVGTGTCVYKGKELGNVLQFKSLVPTGTSLSITSDDNNIYFSASSTGGGGSGFTASANGLTDDGTTVCLGGTLTNNTSICGDNTYAFSATCMSNICLGTQGIIRVGDSTGAGDTTYIYGCGTSSVSVGPSDVVICSNADGDILYCINKSASDGCHVFCTGCFVMCDLPAKVAETNILYVDSAGKISSGVTTSISAGASGDTQLSDGSGGFICSPIGDMTQISGGSLLYGISNSVTGPSTCINEAHGWSNSLENSWYSYAFGYNNCICRTSGGVYATFIAGDTNYDNCSFGNNVLMGYGNTAWHEAYISVALGNQNALCCDPSGGVNYGIALGDSNCLWGVGPVGIGYANGACDYAYALGYTNDAEGELSAAIGYGNVTCVGAIGAIAIGDSNMVCSGACGAMAHGSGGLAEVPSERVSSAGGVGDSQFGGSSIHSRGYTKEINFFGYTSGTTSPVAHLQTYRSASFTDKYFDLTPRLHAMGFQINVTGTDLTNNDSASFFFEGAIKMSGSGGTVSFVGTPSCTAYCDSGFNVNAQIYANNTDKRLDICVTGETATCIGWAATLYGTQVRKFCP